MFYFDPMYFVFLLPALLFAGWAQFQVKHAYSQASKQGARLSGAEAAQRLLSSQGLNNVRIEKTSGHLSDHYDPKHKVLRLSEGVYSGYNLAAVGIAAHEAGHAFQDAEEYAPLVLRNGIVPLASFGSNASWILLLLGALLGSMNLIVVGIGLFSLVVLFQLVNLPVEFNASSRARKFLLSSGLIASSDDKEVAKVLNAAALTYVAATVTAILTLLYYLWRLGLLGGSRQ